MSDFLLTKDEMLSYFDEVNRRLEAMGKNGEILILGGAALSLVYDARDSTRDIDAIFHPAEDMRAIIKDIANEYNLEEGWLNDGAKSYLTPEIHNDSEMYRAYSNLTVYNVDAKGLLALKLTSARDETFPDMSDSIFLMNVLNIQTEDELYYIISKYTHPHLHTPKVQYFIMEAFEKYTQERASAHHLYPPQSESQHKVSVSVKFCSHNDSPSLASAWIEIDNYVGVTNVLVKQGDNGLFVVYPHITKNLSIFEYVKDDTGKLTTESKALKTKIEDMLIKATDTRAEGIQESRVESPKEHDLNVVVTRLRNESPVKATASIQYGNALIVNGYRIIEHDTGELFVRGPSKVLKLDVGNTSRKEVAGATNKEYNEKIKSAILSEYRNQTAFLDNAKAPILAEKDVATPKRSGDAR